VTELPAFGEANGVVVVAPQGHQPDFGWMWEPGEAGVEPGLANRDVAVIDALIDQLGNEMCLDLARVYATGYSIGGHGATAIACRLSDRIAAIVTTAGFTDLGTECEASRVVPMLAMAGTADEYILFTGGLGDFLSDQLPWGTTKGDEAFFNRPDWSLPPIERLEAVAVRNGCEPGPTATPLSAAAQLLTWSCPAGADHALIVVDGGGHDWLIEGGDIDANQVYWDFLSGFALPE
jgi:polyhydroxybutyrate depolymerase